MRRRYKTHYKLMFLPLWLALTAVFVVVGISLLSSSGNEAIAVYEQEASYRLFAAVPQKGEVLGYSVTSADVRVKKVAKFLAQYRSPMVDTAEAMVETADKYNLPWNLLPAIACKESGCGRVLPSNSFNAFGWAIYTGKQSGAVFTSWEHSYEVVAKGLRENYYDKGFDTIEKIETKYTPPSARTHGGWRTGIHFFMDELESMEL